MKISSAEPSAVTESKRYEIDSNFVAYFVHKLAYFRYFEANHDKIIGQCAQRIKLVTETKIISIGPLVSSWQQLLAEKNNFLLTFVPFGKNEKFVRESLLRHFW